MPDFRRGRPCAFAAGLVFLAATAASGGALASAGCDQLSSGIFNLTNFSSGSPFTIGSGPFDLGDRIELTVSGQAGTVNLLDPGTNVVLTYTLPGGAGTQTYVVASAGIHILGMNSVQNLTATAQCLAATGETSSEAAKGFLLSRINGILLNDPSGTSLRNRSGGIVTGSTGAGTSSAALIGAGRGDDADTALMATGALAFSTSLSQARRNAARAQLDRDLKALGANAGATPPAASDIDSPWDLWAEGRFSGFNDNGADLGRDGHLGLLTFGSDYRVTPDMIVGALVQFDWAKETSSAIDSSVEGTGWMAGPYLSARLHENIYLDLRAAWGQSSNSLAVGDTTGSFDTSRWLVKGKLAGNWVHDSWRITPSAELAYMNEHQDAFTNSDDILVPDQDVSVGRLQFGQEFGYRIRQTANSYIEPFVALKGVWDFANPNAAVVAGGTIGPGGFWGRLEGGVSVATGSGWSARGLVSWDGIGSPNYSGFALQGSFNLPLN